jgi:hypothetical protein
MAITSIGIQSISGRTGTAQQPVPQPPANDNDHAGETGVIADDAADAKQTPPPPGMGKYVDRTV